MSSQWYMYVVECSDGTLYTGISTNVKRRILEHNYGDKAAKYTKSRRPVELQMYEKFLDRSSASKAEWRFKKLKRKKKLQIIAEWKEHEVGS